jgi:hypothetical protein
MDAEWSAECGVDDPVLVVPWASEEADEVQLHFVDLRENPYDLDQIEEAERHPPLLQALRALNAGRSPVFTAKCDAWTMSAEELEHLSLSLGIDAAEAHEGFVSYIDLIWRERSFFVSRHRHEQLLDGLVRGAEPLDLTHAAIECVVRPALVDLAGPQEGFAVTLYVKALGMDVATAYANWSEALDAAVALIRTTDRNTLRKKMR